MIDLYSFQSWPLIERSFTEYGGYTPSMIGARADCVRSDGDAEWWDSLQPAYEWLKTEMVAAGLHRPSSDATPVWAWAQWVDDKGMVRHRPDRRSRWFREGYEDCDLIHLRVDPRRCLFTRFDAFNMVINDWPTPPLEAHDWDDATYDRWLDEHWDEPTDERRKLWHENVIVPYDDLPHEWVQATLWTIRPEDVKQVWKR
ncbi:DUF3841 domain-containing protein [Bifidobacterium sp. SO1]|uniref:DUF3841 domain-containing protein n=1 Tax=Bifidobacterium sp. SO1 TaxID=2809029 RepID=UPI001BDC3517|nr:DUF3841 domain-containing protein [Bifidobacterium sp. SO1]MBT1162899.1 DUF3841 domain-containing protein [Bifidobacterium sp. SO1]